MTATGKVTLIEDGLDRRRDKYLIIIVGTLEEWLHRRMVKNALLPCYHSPRETTRSQCLQ